MFRTKEAFSGFSVLDLEATRTFYTKKLGLRVEEQGSGLLLYLPNGYTVFMYPKENHIPATFTILNFVVDDIHKAVDALVQRGVQFEHYDDGPPLDEKHILRGRRINMGPDIAWFKDPSGNILSVLCEDDA